MKSAKTLPLLLGLTTVWAVVSTGLYWQLKNNPRVIAVTTELNKDTSADIPLSDIERLTFFRQFLDRYFNYDSNSFWQSQTSLAYLMAPDLRQQRLKEIDRLRDKVQQKNLSQQGSLVALSQVAQGEYLAKVQVQITENDVRRSLFVTLKLELSQTERSIENPWALNIEKLIFEKSSPVAPDSTLILRLHFPGSIVLSIPCAVESVVNPKESVLRTRITTLNTSEVQITALAATTEATTLSILCKETEYTFTIGFNSEAKDLYAAYPTSIAKPRVQQKTPQAPRKKDAFDKAIDEAMGMKSNY